MSQATPTRARGASREVVIRWVLVAGVYVWAAAVAIALFTVSAYSSSTSTGATSSSTVYQQNPGPVTVISIVLAGVCVLATASLAWRVHRRSRRVGIVGMIAGCGVGLLALLGLMTIGIALVPLAALLVLIALPLTTVGDEVRSA
jgi:hypothetical protein